MLHFTFQNMRAYGPWPRGLGLKEEYIIPKFHNFLSHKPLIKKIQRRLPLTQNLFLILPIITFKYVCIM